MHHDELDHLERVPGFVARCVGLGNHIPTDISRRCPDHRFMGEREAAKDILRSISSEIRYSDEDDKEERYALEAIENAVWALISKIDALRELDLERCIEWQAEEDAWKDRA